MATAISLPCTPPITPHACNPRRLVLASAASPCPPRGGGRVGLRSLTVLAAAGVSSSPGLAPDTGAPAWDALGGVSVLAAGTGNAMALTGLWDSTEGVAVVALLRHFGCFCRLKSSSHSSALYGVHGGMFVFRGKELVYSWRDEGTGDHAPLDDVLSACRKIPVA